MKILKSGMEIRFNNTGEKLNKQTASLDRIDSNIGYIKDNVQWVHKHVNQMKWNFDEDYFIDLCRKIVKNNDNT